MSPACFAPDDSLGVALRLSRYLDCQARVLGENGFQALAGGPVGMSILSGLMAIFIGLIGYRLILGETPGVRHGIGWAVRLGFVLALVTSWPAFQTLVFRVAVDGPSELAGIVLPAAGLPSESLDGRIQQAYDTIRLGSIGQPSAAATTGAMASATPPDPLPPQPSQFQPPMPQTASLFVLTTAGFTGAFRIAIGFLLAVGPLAIMALLFDATLGIFAGWIRALTGMAFAALAALIVTALDLLVVEGELARVQALRFGGFGESVDAQGLTTITVVFAMVMIVSTMAAMRMTGAFRLRWPGNVQESWPGGRSIEALRPAVPANQAVQLLSATHDRTLMQSRAGTVAEALTSSMRREQALLIEGGNSSTSSHTTMAANRGAGSAVAGAAGLGTSGRRTLGRRTRSATRRDKSG